ncbi:putative integral to membrane protein [Rhizoctonia solani 123E]|uniref:Putative integral to membrane protein n=1 Tax=Rhizoctonia solani 123E TaxID=1423351 RepID=A0A074RTC3_9AGAM|nr:putative integral to membrane protein [Rhizoctonia solani 123E]
MSTMTRLRWLFLVGLLGARTVSARQAILFTSAVTYCAPPENVLVQELDIRYYRENASVVFDVTASSLRNDLRVALALNLTVYGMQPLSLDLNLCQLASAVCPLPLYNFSGQGTLPIPSSFSSKIPTIGYTVPDLEAYAQLELLRVDTGEVAACVSATLSNGWSMRQPGATWSAVAVVLFSIVTSALWSLSKAKWSGIETGHWAEKELWRVVDVISFVQMIGISALLNLNYPSAYRAFAENFPWVLLLTGPIPSQSAIDHLRQRTGARLGNDALPTDEYVNRKLSPYNQALTLGAMESVVQNVDLGNNYGYSFSSMNTTELGVAKSSIEKRVFINPATVTAGDALPGGVPVYVNGAGVATANAFLGVFFEWLVIGAIMLGVCVAYQLWKRTISRRTHFTAKGQISSEGTVPRVSHMLHGAFLRLALVLIFPVTIFAMYQWTLRDSWLATLLSVLCLLTTWVGLGWTWFKLSHASRPFDDTRSFAALQPSLPMILLLTVPVFIISLFVAFASHSGVAQVAGILVVEILSLAAAIFIRWKARRRERDLALNATPESPIPNLSAPLIPPPTRMGITLRWFRVIAMGLMIPFLMHLGVQPIPRTVIAIVTAAVWGIGVVIIFAYLVWSTVQLFRRKRVNSSLLDETSTDRIVEKETKSPASAIVQPLSPTQHAQTNSDRLFHYNAHTSGTPAPGHDGSGDYFSQRPLQ